MLKGCEGMLLGEVVEACRRVVDGGFVPPHSLALIGSLQRLSNFRRALASTNPSRVTELEFAAIDWFIESPTSGKAVRHPPGGPLR